MPYFVQEAVIPMRREASDAAEMVSQLVFGEICDRLERQEKWWRIRLRTDGYEGWVTPKMLLPVTEREMDRIHTWHYVRSGHLILPDHTPLALPLGGRLPLMEGEERGFSLGQQSWTYGANLVHTPALSQANRVAVTHWFRNVPYLWGGRSGFGIDCSGLTQQVFAICGQALPRDAYQQEAEGQSISFGDRRAGDLAFFGEIEPKRITHVGLLINSHQILHASGRVRCDEFQETGIVHAQHKEVTHQLVSIKRW